MEPDEPRLTPPMVLALKEKANIIFLVLGALLVADGLTGGTVLTVLVSALFRLFGRDPETSGFTIVTIIGDFHSISSFAVSAGRWIGGACLFVVAFSLGRAGLDQILRKY